MKLKVIQWSILCLLSSGCGGTGEYVCPDPIGKIIRDECEVYRTKYETLKVELGASVGPAEIKTALSKSSLRDPSELLQILAHRTHALCRDFNACRVPPIEYRQRREQTDAIFTAVSAIQTQLKGELDAASKAKLVQELVALLSADAPKPRQSALPRRSTHSTRSTPRRVGRYHSSVPWYGAKILPPQPGGIDGFPQVVSAEYQVQAVFRGKSPHGIIGYRPRGVLFLRGKVEPDDMVTFHWGGGKKSECGLNRSQRNNLSSVRCKAPKSVVMSGSSFSVKATYRRGRDGKTAVIDQRRTRVLIKAVEGSKNGSRRFGIDHDPEARRGKLVFRPNGRTLPPSFDQPYLEVVLKLRDYHRATARCWANGKVATAGMKGSRYGGQVGMFQDRPRHERIGPGSSRGVKEPMIEWRRSSFALPFGVPRDGAKLPEKIKPWPLSGDWRCVVSIDGDPIREVTFTVNRDGSLELHDQQRVRPSAAWLLHTKIIKHQLEVPLR